MKIEKLRFENINSLAGQWEVDLTRREYRNGLFLISGDTGAGKATIYDSITLALFGRTMRFDAEGVPNAVLTSGRTSCFAEVEFSCTAGRYLAHWECRQVQESAQGSARQSERRLSRQSDSVWVEVQGAQNELEKTVMELLGVKSFRQFVQMTMLSPTLADLQIVDESGSRGNLTGGECFLSALSSAIELSRQSVGTEQVETLFVDGVFGMLNEKTLDVALSMIESAQRDGLKTVGLLSHGRELEARITTRIGVTRKGHGISDISGLGVSLLS